MGAENKNTTIPRPDIQTIVRDAFRLSGEVCTTEVSSIKLDTIRVNPNTLQHIYNFPDNKIIVLGDPTKSQASAGWDKLYAFVGNVLAKSDTEKIVKLSEIFRTFGYVKEEKVDFETPA